MSAALSLPVTSPDSCHAVILTDRDPPRIKVLESQSAAELWAEDYGETRGVNDEPGIVEEVVFEGQRIGVIRVATAQEISDWFDGGDYFAMGAV